MKNLFMIKNYYKFIYISSKNMEDNSYSIQTDRILNKEKFDSDVFKTVACVMCNKIPIKPVQKPSHEGVFYCTHCLQSFYKEKNLPLAITNSITYKFLFGKIEISCKNKMNGCNQFFLYKKIFDLFDHESKCEKNSIKCPSFENCKVSGLQIEILEHVKICEFIEIKCNKCEHVISRNLFKNHNCINNILSSISSNNIKYESRINILNEKNKNLLTKIEILENENDIMKDELIKISKYFNDLSGADFLKIVYFHPFFKDLIKNKNIILLYKASEHDFSMEKFHNNVDGKLGTITIAKCENNQFIGGYTPVGWKISGDEVNWVSDFSLMGFIFSISHNLKLNLKSAEKALLSSSKYGPSFGKGEFIINESNEESIWNPGKVYKEDEKQLVGKNGLVKIKDYEVFHIIE